MRIERFYLLKSTLHPRIYSFLFFQNVAAIATHTSNQRDLAVAGRMLASLEAHPDFAAFYRDLEWMGVQRHIKVLGIFARLFHRDGKSGYLKDMPLVLRYLRDACERYTELHPLLRLLDRLEHRQPSAGCTF